MYLKVTVNAGAKKEKLEKKKDELKISVKEPAQRNLANSRVRELLAKHFNIPISAVRLLNGHRSPNKLFSIDIDE